jgi:hypothetical protein
MGGPCAGKNIDAVAPVLPEFVARRGIGHIQSPGLAFGLASKSHFSR